MIDTVDPSIVDAVDGKAYQAVAASAALAIQDAVDALRHTTAIATTASGIALSQFLASGDERYLTALPALQQMVAGAVGDFAAVGEAAAKIVSEFPSG
ncbi:MAG TPA: hypothetical protein VF652_12585 [Allosphingosinicella sp.]